MSNVAIDIMQYMPADNQTWMKDFTDKMGWENLCAYYNKLFVRMFDMKPGEKINILEEVRPENYNLFMKCLYTCLSELAGYNLYDYYLENNVLVKGR